MLVYGSAPRPVIAVMIIAHPSVLRLGVEQAIRSMKNCQLVATADNVTFAEEVFGAIKPSVIVAVGLDSAEVPQIWLQASNVVRLTDAGRLQNQPDEKLSVAMLEDAIFIAYATLPPSQKRGADIAREPAQPRAIAPKKTKPVPTVQLGEQQQRVLNLMAKGLTNAEIARVMGLSLPTARYHVSAILNKMGATNRTEACALAVTQGITTQT